MKQLFLTLFVGLILVLNFNSLKIKQSKLTPMKKEFLKRLVEYSKKSFDNKNCVKSNENVKVVYVDESLPFKYLQQFYENLINSAEKQTISNDDKRVNDLEIILICKDKTYESFAEYVPKKPFMKLKNDLLESIKIKSSLKQVFETVISNLKEMNKSLVKNCTGGDELMKALKKKLKRISKKSQVSEKLLINLKELIHSLSVNNYSLSGKLLGDFINNFK